MPNNYPATTNEALEKKFVTMRIVPISLPTPFYIGPVNVYLIAEDPITIIDTGPKTKEAIAALRAGLRGAGFLVSDIRRIVLTHAHEDHCGLARSLRDEAKNAETQFKLSPVGYLESLGFLGPGVLAAHGVWVSEPDIALLTMRHVGISHNPESNMKLASGTAPVPAYLRADAAIGLGTDGAASNNDLDMFEAMRMASLLHKLQSADPRAVSAKTALEMATIRGARALGMESRIGSLETGKRADLILVDVSGARQTPMYDPVSHLVYVSRGDDVRTTIVNGRILMREKKVLTLDEAQVLRDARAWADRVRGAVR